jgi:hypothetical protein
MKSLNLLFSIPIVLLLIVSCSNDSKGVEPTKNSVPTTNIDVTEQWNSFVDSLWTEPTFNRGRKFVSEKVHLNMSQFVDNFFHVKGTIIDIDGDNVLLDIRRKQESVLMNPIEHYLFVLSEITNGQDFELKEGSTVTISGNYSTYNFKIKNGFKAVVSLKEGKILEVHKEDVK